MSDFFSLSWPNMLAAVWSADNWRSVLKMLNSLSSWPKAAPVSAVPASLVLSSNPWPSPTIIVSMMLNRRSRSSVKSCSTSTAPPLIPQDRHEIRRCHLRSYELLPSRKRAYLIRGRHGSHVEVQRQQTAIFVASFAWSFW